VQALPVEFGTGGVPPIPSAMKCAFASTFLVLLVVAVPAHAEFCAAA
jgi:hypothetical protein